MNVTLDDIVSGIFIGIVFIILFFFGYSMALLVDLLVNEEECVSLGYPKVSNTYNFRTYCYDPVNIHMEQKVYWLE